MRTGPIALLAVVGCAADEGRQQPPLANIDLRIAMQTTEDIRPIGLAIAADGQRFVFDENAGLYRIDGDQAVVVVPLSAMPNPGPTAQVQLPYTDIVALGPNLFALTAIGDGYLLDTAAMTLQQHFCYVPDDIPMSLTQRTDAIAYDAATQRLFAQPLTYDAADVFQYAQVAAYERATGVDVAWYNTSPDVAATGMISHPSVGGLVLGQGSRLSRFDMTTSQSIALDDLARFGVRSIDGLAIDPVAGTLVVVDKQTDTMFDIELSSITF